MLERNIHQEVITPLLLELANDVHVDMRRSRSYGTEFGSPVYETDEISVERRADEVFWVYGS